VLLLTLIIEDGIAWLFGFRTVRQLLAVSMVNCISNPALNLLLLILAWQGYQVSLAWIIPLEVGVVIVEWWLLKYSLSAPGLRVFAFSLTANTISFLAGIFIFWL
jgi:hypothetical protein